MQAKPFVSDYYWPIGGSRVLALDALLRQSGIVDCCFNVMISLRNKRLAAPGRAVCSLLQCCPAAAACAGQADLTLASNIWGVLKSPPAGGVSMRRLRGPVSAVAAVLLSSQSNEIGQSGSSEPSKWVTNININPVAWLR
jgi:hypothetical protein